MKSFYFAILCLLVIIVLVIVGGVITHKNVSVVMEQVDAIYSAAEIDSDVAFQLAVSREEEVIAKLHACTYFLKHLEIDAAIISYLNIGEYLKHGLTADAMQQAVQLKFLLTDLKNKDMPLWGNIL